MVPSATVPTNAVAHRAAGPEKRSSILGDIVSTYPLGFKGTFSELLPSESGMSALTVVLRGASNSSLKNFMSMSSLGFCRSNWVYCAS